VSQSSAFWRKWSETFGTLQFVGQQIREKGKNGNKKAA